MRRALVRRVGGGDEQDLVEPQLLARLLGAAQMGEVDGVEGAAEDADARGSSRSRSLARPCVAATRRASRQRICPLPWITYLYVVSSRRPIGPRACRRLVEMPTSAPKPNS